jgi:hypothetical protein
MTKEVSSPNPHSSHDPFKHVQPICILRGKLRHGGALCEPVTLVHNIGVSYNSYVSIHVLLD